VIRILGTGALASYLGGRLARAGVPVVLAGSWTDGLAALSRSGVTVHEDGESWTEPLRAVGIGGSLEPAEWVLVLAKSPQTPSLVPHAHRNLAPGGTLVTFQNGLGNREILQAGPGRVLQGVSTTGVTLLRPGEVRALAGTWLLEEAPSVPALVALFRRAGLEAETTPEIEVAVWRKLAVNCAINPLSALLGVANGALLEDPATRERLCEAAREVARVAEARGTPLGVDPVTLVAEVARKTGSNRSSMLQDLDRGLPTEIESLNGALVAEAARRGVPVPVNTSLLASVRALERKAV
jgi:2-dehydropantoate 2-reductase